MTWISPEPPRRRPALLAALALLLAACGGADGGSPAAGEARATGEGAGVLPQAGGLAVLDPHHPAHPGWRDLGIIPLGETATHVVRLENREGRPLVIQSLRAGCGCAVPRIAYRAADGELVAGDPRSSGHVLELPAGAIAELTVEIDSRRAPVKNAPKRVNVRLVTDSASDPYLTIELQFLVQVHFQVAPEALDLGEVAEHGMAEGSTRIQALEELALAGPPPAPPGYEVWLEDADTLGRRGWNLHARALPPRAQGYSEVPLRLPTRWPDGREGPPLEVPLRSTGVPDVEVEPARLFLRGEDGAPAAEVTVKSNLAGQRLALALLAVEGPQAAALQVELLPEHPGAGGESAVWKVRLTAQAELPSGPLEGVVALSTGDPAVPELRVPYLRLAAP